MSDVVTIYGLFDPFSGRCRYVGKTKHSLDARFRGHLSDAARRGNGVRRFRWINELALIGAKPLIFPLESVESSRWQDCEKKWIRFMRDSGGGLLNGTDGGDGIHGHIHSEETKKRQSVSALKRYEDQEERKRTGEAVRVALSNPESRKRLSAARKACCTPEYRALMSRLSTGRVFSEEHRRRLSQRVFTEEWRRKLSEAAKGRKTSDEARKRMSEIRKGRSHGEETKKKMSESAKRRWKRLQR